jgi:shikimate dehydrogenase
MMVIHPPSTLESAMPSPAVQPLLALLACPVGGNPTQYMIEKALVHHDLDWRFLTFEVTPEKLADAVRGLRALGFRGAHCADPHKQAVIPLLDRITETAAASDAVNFVFREDDHLVGENTEGKGVVDAIRKACDPVGKQIVLMGAGRTARTVAIELAAAGAAGLTVVNRTLARAEELAAILSKISEAPTTAASGDDLKALVNENGTDPIRVSAVAWQGDYAVPPEADVLIHATSVDQDSDEARLPLILESLRPELLVADVNVYTPQTWLLREAAERGCNTVNGLTMFIEQIAIGMRLWTGVDPDRSVLREAAEEFLEL